MGEQIQLFGGDVARTLNAQLVVDDEKVESVSMMYALLPPFVDEPATLRTGILLLL
jgi:hypothetical protein